MKHPQYKKDYYSLTEMLEMNLVHLKQKQLSVRFNQLLKDGKLVYGKNLHRVGSAWQLHISTFPLFGYKYMALLQHPVTEIDIYNIVLNNRIAIQKIEEKQSKK